MHNRDEQARKPKLIRVADVLKLTVFGWYFASCLLLGVFGGWALDKWLDTNPLFIALGLLLGSILGFYGMYRMMQPFMRQAKSKKEKPQ